LRAAAPRQVKAIEHEVALGDPAFVSRARNRRLLVGQGFLFRDDDALARHATRVREVFTPQPVVLDAARRATEGNLVVGVHRRRGDYRDWHEGRYFYEDDVLARAMTRIEALHPHADVTFLVCSDEPLDTSAFTGQRVRSGPGTPVADLYALAHCDLLTGPPSTFTAWASFWGAVPLATLEEPDQQYAPDSFAVAWTG
jgi:hypothetical protein